MFLGPAIAMANLMASECFHGVPPLRDFVLPCEENNAVAGVAGLGVSCACYSGLLADITQREQVKIAHDVEFRKAGSEASVA